MQSQYHFESRQVTVEIVVIWKARWAFLAQQASKFRKKPLTCIALHTKLALWKVPVLSDTEPNAT